MGGMGPLSTRQSVTRHGALVSLLLFQFIVSGHAQEKKTQQLTPWNFEEHVGGEKHVLAMFHAPWCGACKKYMPEFDQVAMSLGTIPTLSVMKADVTEFEYEELKGPRLNVSKVPAIKLFKKHSTTPLTMEPKEHLHMQFAVKEKLGMPVPNKCMFGDSDAEDIHVSNWDKVVLDPNTSVLVEFFAPWCSHCQRFKSTYNLIARKASRIPGIKAVRVNADKDKPLMERYGIKRLPTLMAFTKKNKTGTVLDMPEVDEYIQLVDTLLARLQRPEPDAKMEAEAKVLFEKVEQAHGAGLADEAIKLLNAAPDLNITQVWTTRISPLRTKLMETKAFSMKEAASKLAGEGDWLAALEILKEITEKFGDTEVSKSEAVENLIHNSKAMLAMKGKPA